MTFNLKAGISALALTMSALFATTATAADLGGPTPRGSIKDAVPIEMRAAAGPCYFRADAGFSASRASHAVLNDYYFGNASTSTVDLAAVNVANTWLFEAGAGCGWGGSRGFRIEAMVGSHGERDFKATVPAPQYGNVDRQMSGHLKTYTAMLNAYKDFGNFAGFVPYFGAGIGVAYNALRDITVTGVDWNGWYNYEGDKVGLAWALMAGVGYQISDRAIVDVGYRYIDMGNAGASWTNFCACGKAEMQNVKITDNAAHEFKVGLRYYTSGESFAAAGAAVSDPAFFSRR